MSVLVEHSRGWVKNLCYICFGTCDVCWLVVFWQNHITNYVLTNKNSLWFVTSNMCAENKNHLLIFIFMSLFSNLPCIALFALPVFFSLYFFSSTPTRILSSFPFFLPEDLSSDLPKCVLM